MFPDARRSNRDTEDFQHPGSDLFGHNPAPERSPGPNRRRMALLHLSETSRTCKPIKRRPIELLCPPDLHNASSPIHREGRRVRGYYSGEPKLRWNTGWGCSTNRTRDVQWFVIWRETTSSGQPLNVKLYAVELFHHQSPSSQSLGVGVGKWKCGKY